jgi:hypothetical protein
MLRGLDGEGAAFGVGTEGAGDELGKQLTGGFPVELGAGGEVTAQGFGHLGGVEGDFDFEGLVGFLGGGFHA